MALVSQGNHILITNYKQDNQGAFSADNTEVVGAPTAEATFTALDSDHPAVDVGCNAKIAYLHKPGSPVYFVADTCAQLVAASNGTILAS
jgi:hypothetical protein